MWYISVQKGVCGESPPDISIHDAAVLGNIKAAKKHLAAGKDVNAPDTYTRRS